MAESLFTDAHLDGANLDENDSQAYTLGTVIDVAVDGVVTHGRWRFPTTPPSGPVSWVLYDYSTETEIARAVFASPTAGAWNTAALSSPVSLTAGQRVVACVETPDRYVAKGGLFTNAIVSGNLTGPATSTVPNGRFALSHATFPEGSAGGSGYFGDLVFDNGAGGTTLAASASGSSTSAGSATARAVRRTSASGSSTTAGSAAATARLAAAAAASALSAGSAAATVVTGPTTYTASATGAAASGGTAIPALTARVTASAATATTGAAAARMLLAALAQAAAVSAGRAMAVVVGDIVTRPHTGTTARPGGGVTERPFAGTTVRP